MRDDEKLAKAAIIKWCIENGLGSPQVVYEPNGISTAPDFLFGFRDKSYFVEVCRSKNGVFINDEITDWRDRYEGSALKKSIEVLKTLISEWLPRGKTLILILLSPFPLHDRKYLIDKLNKTLKLKFSENSFDNENKVKGTIETKDNDVKEFTYSSFITDYYKDNDIIKLIPASHLNKNYASIQNLLSLQARTILINSVEDKTDRLKNFDNLKWLGIINTNPSLSPNDYISAIKDEELGIVNDLERAAFERIFVVDRGIATEIFRKKLK